jgi:hypothetical protein
VLDAVQFDLGDRTAFKAGKQDAAQTVPTVTPKPRSNGSAVNFP